MNWILFATAAVALTIYARAINNLFSRDHGVHPKMKVLQVVAGISALTHLWCLGHARPTLLQASISFAVYGLSLLVFFAAKRALGNYRLTLAFSPDEPHDLIDCGIYGRIRHPIYSAYTLTWAAGVVAAPSVWTIASMLIMLCMYWGAARMEEEKFAASALASRYAQYRRSAGLFWPKF